MSEFSVGDRVLKCTGYEYEGTVVSVFKKRNGDDRLVVENPGGMLFIFTDSQLMLDPRDPGERLEVRVAKLAAAYRESAKRWREKKGTDRDAQQDEYEWKKHADTLDGFAQALEDVL